MKNINNILTRFDTSKRLTEGAAYPLVAYAVIKLITAKELYDYFAENSLKVSLSSVQNWRRNAANLLGLAPQGRGRESFFDQKEAREKWHRINGHPTVQMLIDGWMPKGSITNDTGSLGVVSTTPSDLVKTYSRKSRVVKNDKSSSPPKLDLKPIEQPRPEVLDPTKFINGE